MKHTIITIAGLILVTGLSVFMPLQAKPITTDQLPEPLKPWVEWVKHKHTELDCPVMYNRNQRECTWPGELTIKANTQGATFTQSLTVYRDSHFSLPGDARMWPTDIMVNGKPAPVVEYNQSPALWLQAGEYRIHGMFQWQRMPDAIKLNQSTGIVHYELNGQVVRHPQRRQDKLWLQTGQQRESDKAPEDRLSLEVYRLVADGHPLQVTTHLQIQVSGAQREVVIGSPLLGGFIPLQIISSLPARLEPNNTLRIQVRPGRWQVRVIARHPDAVTQLAMSRQETPWPDSEVWVYRSAPQDRLTEIQNVPQIDPRQIQLPGDWSNLPAYQVNPDVPMQIKVVRRGDPEPEPDQLNLQRDLWLDFTGQGFTVRDQINGKMTRDWRLSIDPALSLGRVTIDGKAQFITRLDNDDREGVEVRRGQLNLQAESRIDSKVRTLPSTGWGRDMQSVKAILHLPPGWQLVAVTGVDNVPDSWVQRWTLYDLFIVLIATIASAKLWGWKWSPLVLITLALTWHEPGAPRMIWLYLLAGIALLRVAPSDGKLHRFIRFAQRIGYLALVIIALPFMVDQAREGLYPQLERHWANPQTFTTQAVMDRPLSAPAAPAEPRLRVASEAIKEQVVDKAVRMKSAARSVVGGMGDVVDEIPSQRLDELDPNANIQTGPGLPDWKWDSAQLQWNGPVAADQQIRLFLLGPVEHLLLNFAMIGFIIAFALRVIGYPPVAGRRLRQLLIWPLVVLPLAGVPTDSVADVFPSPELLKELERRLIEFPVPAPRASVPSLHIEVKGDQLHARLDVDALTATIIPLPIDIRQATPVRVQMDERVTHDLVYHTRHQQLWMLVPKGKHKVKLQAWLPNAEQVQIPLHLKPRRVTTQLDGWSVEGISREGVPDQQLSLVRTRQVDEAKTTELTPTSLPPMLRVERTLYLGLQWEVHTQVQRISPTGTPISVSIPVVPGASVVTEGRRVKDGQVLVNLAATQRSVSWRSRLDPVDSLTLVAPDDTNWLETWRTHIGPTWHAELEGIAPIHHQDSANNWLPAWHPWPGEQLTLNVSRPHGIEGPTMTIDASSLTTTPGKRVTDSVFKFTLRASQGGQYDLQLPEGVQLQSVKINNRTQPVRQDKQTVSLPVVPGVQNYELNWRASQGISGQWTTPTLGLPGDSVNAQLVVHVPRDRWSLWVSGPDMGPAVLFWGVLVVLVLVAYALGRAGKGRVPLGFLSWLLLAIGLSQVSVSTGIIVVGWFFFMYYRSQMTNETPKWVFNASQLGAVILTLASLLVLLWVVKQGLLGYPQMQIEGYGSHAWLMNWYLDRVTDSYPQALIISVPLLVYRLLMLAWALWLAFALLKWLKWSWQAFSSGGLWRSIDLAKVGTTKKRDDGLIGKLRDQHGEDAGDGQ